MLEGKRFSGARIRQARHECGMSQSQLARAAGTRERNIVRWENEQHAPRLENIIRIADATGKPVEFFFADGEDSAESVSREQKLRNVGLAIEALTT